MINIYKSLEQAEALGFKNIQSLLIFYFVAYTDGDVYSDDIANKLPILRIKTDTIGRYIKKMIDDDLLKSEKQGRNRKVSLSDKGKAYLTKMEKNPQKTERTKPEKNPQNDEEIQILRMKESLMSSLYFLAVSGQTDPDLFKKAFNTVVDQVCKDGYKNILFDLLADVFKDTSKLKI